MNQKNILVILPTFGDTKDSKRIKLLKISGFKINVAYFIRNQFLSREPVADSFVQLGKVTDGKYLTRLVVYIKSIFVLRKLSKHNDLIYAIGIDLAILCFFASIGLKNKFIIDVADIRPIQVSNSLFGKILRYIEIFITKRASLIVVTSKGFIDYYYKEILGLKSIKYFLLENKVDYEFHNVELSRRLKNDKIVLGYFGVLRDKWTLMFINKLVETYPEKFEGIIAGINLLNTKDFSKLISTSKQIKYLGPYKSPEDLFQLYDKIDVMLVFYPEFNSSDDWFNAKKICRSNRFYEAGYFKKPLISFSFSGDGKEIERMDIGMTLNNYDLDEAVNVVGSKLNFQNLESWKQNFYKISNNTFQFYMENEILAKKIKEII